jgi:predicted peroxiredoxin
LRFLYLVSKGTEDATGASVPVHLAVNGSAEIGHETQLLLVGDGAEVAIASKTEGLAGLGLPPMAELLSKLRDHQIPVYV